MLNTVLPTYCLKWTLLSLSSFSYRPISQGESPILGLKPKRSYSLPGTPIEGLYSTNPPKKSQSGSATSTTKARRNLVSTRLSTPTRGVAREGVRVTRSMSREQQEKKELKEREEEIKMETTPTEESTNGN